MPISVLNLLVARGIQASIPSSQSLALDEIFWGKMGTIVLATILGIYVFIWSRELYGISAAFLALILYVLDPSIIAHSRLFTQDIPGACFVFIATYYFWRMLHFGGRVNAILSAISFGIAQISRYTSIHLVPIFIILSIFYYTPSLIAAKKSKSFSTIQPLIRKASLYILAILFATILILNVGYSFERTPIDHVAYSYLVFPINENDLKEILK